MIRLCPCGKRLYAKSKDFVKCWTCRRKEERAAATPRECPGGSNPKGKLPEHPTRALPGTEEKMQVISERLHRGESGFHPLDATGTT